jgi:protein-L-isoaspartate(D-aspartate) O-methyltransferase
MVSKFLVCIIIAGISLGCDLLKGRGEAMTVQRLEKMRNEMVESQIIARGIHDKLVIEAMRKVPRHEFVEKSLWEEAYSDYPLPIGEGQTISQPYIVALMTELLELKGGEKVLEVGTGSGYQAAILGEIAGHVYTVEIVEKLAVKSTEILKRLGYKNIDVRAKDGYAGWPENAPFDGIMITASAPKIPQPLIDQLKMGGILVLPVGDEYQELIVVRRTPKGVEKKEIIPVRFVPMVGEVQKK